MLDYRQKIIKMIEQKGLYKTSLIFDLTQRGLREWMDGDETLSDYLKERIAFFDCADIFSVKTKLYNALSLTISSITEPGIYTLLALRDSGASDSLKVLATEQRELFLSDRIIEVPNRKKIILDLNREGARLEKDLIQKTAEYKPVIIVAPELTGIEDKSFMMPTFNSVEAQSALRSLWDESTLPENLLTMISRRICSSFNKYLEIAKYLKNHKPVTEAVLEYINKIEDTNYDFLTE